MALLALLVLRPIEIHPEAAAGAGLLVMLLALLAWLRVGGADLLAPLAPYAAFLLPFLGLNLALSCEQHQSLLVLSRWVLLLALGIALTPIARGGGAWALARLAAALGSGVSLVAIWQGLFGLKRAAAVLSLDSGPLREAILARLGSGRVFGTFILPASLGGALAVTLPLTILLLLARGRLPRHPLLLAAAVVQGAALVWTFSLGAWLSLIAAALVVLAATWAGGARKRRLLAAGIIAGGMLVGGGVLARRAWLPQPGAVDRPLAYRIGNWGAALSMFRDHPVTGTGLGTFGSVFPAYRSAAMNESRFAHSSWLQLLAETGAGAVPLLALVAALAFFFVRRARDGPLEAAAAIGGLAFLIQNSIDFTAYQPSVTALFVLACVLTLAPPSSREAAPGGRRIAHWTVAAVLAAGAGGFLVVSGLSDLEREKAMMAHGAEPERERRALKRSVRLDPLDPQPRGDLARLLSAYSPGTSEIEEAWTEAARAVAIDPVTPFRRRDLGLLELKLGRPAEAWTSLAWASALYPLGDEYRGDLTSLEERLFRSPAPGGEP